MNTSSHWSVLDAQTRPIHNYNDDAYGFTRERLWVIDGATGISDVHCTPHASDAAWLAERTSTLLESLPAAPLTELLGVLQEQVKSVFSQAQIASAPADLQDQDMPCACLGLVQLQGEHVEIACVGDISVVVSEPDNTGVQVFSDTAAARFSEKTLQHWHQLKVAQHGADEAWSRLRTTIRGNRNAVNMPDGYTVIHPKRDWAHRVTIHRIPLHQDMRVLLASDGLWRLVDLFGTHDAQSMLDFATENHLPALLTQLRTLEAQDSDGQRYLRVKPCDDATGLLARLEGYAP